MIAQLKNPHQQFLSINENYSIFLDHPIYYLTTISIQKVVTFKKA